MENVLYNSIPQFVIDYLAQMPELSNSPLICEGYISFSDEFVEYFICEENENLFIYKCNIELSRSVVFKVKIPADSQNFETLMQIIDDYKKLYDEDARHKCEYHEQ